MPNILFRTDRWTRRLAAAAIVLWLATGCSTFKGNKEAKVSVPNAQWWTQAQRGADPVARNLSIVKQRMAPAVPIPHTVGIAETPEINAFATIQDGRMLVVFTQGFLREFGNDPDVIATTLGHEIAHHTLGHTDPSYQRKRSAAEFAASQLLGTAASYFVPFSGLLVGQAVHTVTLSFSRDDERAADTQGMIWAWQAGYSPCGSWRFASRLSKLGQDATLPFLSTHPGNPERMSNAQAFVAARNLPACR